MIEAIRVARLVGLACPARWRRGGRPQPSDPRKVLLDVAIAVTLRSDYLTHVTTVLTQHLLFNSDNRNKHFRLFAALAADTTTQMLR